MHSNLLLISMLMALLLAPLHASAADTLEKGGMANGKTAPSTILPVPIEKSFLEGKALTLDNPEEYDSYTDSEGKVRNPSFSHEFHNDKIHVSVIEAGPDKVRIDGLPYDEFVQILEGRLILTPDGGDESYEYKTGDSFVVPKGYTGTGHMPEKYRELVVIDTSYLESE